MSFPAAEAASIPLPTRICRAAIRGALPGQFHHLGKQLVQLPVAPDAPGTVVDEDHVRAAIDGASGGHVDGGRLQLREENLEGR